MLFPRLTAKTLHRLAEVRIPECRPHRGNRSTLCATLLSALLFPTIPSPGAEQFLVTPTAVTSSSSATDFFAATNLINNSGLDPVPTLTNYQNAQHGSASPSRAWATAARGRDYFASGQPNPALTFTLPDLYQITHLVVWGFYYTSPNNSEARKFTLEFSTNSGRTWTGQTDVTHRKTADEGEAIPLDRKFQANAVRLIVTDNYYVFRGVGGERVGLGEIKFIGQPPAGPDPSVSLRPLVDFGSNSPGEPILSRTLAIENVGSQPLTIAPLAPVPPFVISGGPLEIPPGGSRPLTIDLPPVPGCHLVTLELATNDPARPIVPVNLMGAYDCLPKAPSQPDILPGEGTFVDPFEVTITSEDQGVIIYTTDGSIPSSNNGIPYTGPVVIDSSTQLRAAVARAGSASKPQTRSYLRLTGGLETYTSPIPIAIIDNFGGGTIPNKEWSFATQTSAGLQQLPRQPASLHLIDTNPESGRASITGLHDLTERIGIRVRGSFSSTWNPKPYSLETWDEYDADKSTSPLGLPGESDWILYYPHPLYDRQLIANTFSWELSRQTGRYGTRFRLVDTFINQDGGDLTPADRVGVYAFAEKVTRDDDRIEFEPLSEDGSTGGWLLSINRMDPIPVGGFPTENGALAPQFFHTAGPDRMLQTSPNQLNREGDDDIPRQYNGFFNFEDPNGYRINAAQRNAIENWFEKFEDVLYDDARWLDPVDGYRRYVDTRDFIDYFHLHNLAKQGDSMALSLFPWFSSRDRKLRIGPIWDYNLSAYWTEPTEELFYRNDRIWYPRFFEDPRFMREYIDRWYELRRGPFATPNLTGLVNQQARQFTSSLAIRQGLSARAWSTGLADMKTYLSIRTSWIDSQFFRPPTFSHPGGTVSGQFTLSILNNTGEVGTIFLTLDGSDPIDGGGTVYTDPISLNATAHVRARVRSTNGEWSALNEASYVTGTPPKPGDLVLSEIMYHPLGDPGAEFIEVLNINPVEALDLALIRFAAGVEFTFPVGATLAPGERIIVVRNRSAFEAVHGMAHNVVGEFQLDSALDNSGDRIILLDASGSVLLDFSYGDDPPWAESADGDGDSLILIDPLANPDHGVFSSWRSSTTTDGNPGNDDRVTFSGDPVRDRDNDGIPALVEFLLGTPEIREDLISDFFTWNHTPGGETELLLAFSLATRAIDMPAIEFSNDLETWQEVTVEPAFDEYLTAGRARYRWLLPAPQPAQRYFRIQVAETGR